nr:GNAT family N-acetyltransferase [Neobacillus terrae]
MNFFLPEEQKKFTGMPENALPLALEDPDRTPVVILSEDNPVGFFVLHIGSEIFPFTNNPDAVLLRAFSINHGEQGKGYAKQAMLLLAGFVKTLHPDKKEIILAVNAKNTSAKSLYLKTGFRDNGQEREGSRGMQHILHMNLS